MKIELLILMNDLDGALEINNEAIEKFPKLSIFYTMKSAIMTQLRKYDLALELVEIAIRLMKNIFLDISMNYNLKVEILIQMKKYEEALDTLQKFSEKYSDYSLKSNLNLLVSDQSILNKKAYLLAKLNKKKDSIQLIEELIKKEPDNIIHFDTYGNILIHFKEFERAIEILEKVMKLGEEIHEILYQSYDTYIKIGKCYKGLGKFKIALENLNRGKILAEKRNDIKWIEKAEKYILEIENMIK